MADSTGTPDENLSTEHQKDGDARHPSDTLDREQTPESNDTPAAHERAKQ